MRITNLKEAIDNPGILLNEEQLEYIKGQFGIDTIPDYHSTDFYDLYDALADLEVEEIIKNKGNIAGDIVTIFGNLIEEVGQ